MKSDDLHRDINDATTLSEDLRALLQDAQDDQDGWKICYAVDFAEIHAYVLPDERKAMRIFRDDNVLIENTLQENALQRVLLDGHPVLLPPYFFELDNFLNNQVQPKVFSKMAVSAAHLAEHARAIAALPEFEPARRAVERYQRGESNEEDLLAVRRFVELHADLVAAMKSFDAASPSQRLRRLLSAGRFLELEELVGEAVEPDSVVYARWSAGLKKRRKDRDDGTNRLDALAIALIKTANERLEPQKIKLRLVTRSSFMHAQMKEELGEWGESVLRHPRCFGVFFDADSRPSDAVAPLRELLTSVEAFLDAARPGLRRQTTTPSNDDPVRTMLDEVKKDWRRALELATIASHSAATPAVAGAGVTELVEIVNVINRNVKLRDVLRDLSRELYEEIPKAYQILGLLVQGRGTEMRRHFEEDIGAIAPSLDEDNTVVLASTRDNLPYRLEFYSDELRNWVALFSGKKLDWNAITGFFVKALEGKAGDYEVLLALAYLLCATGNWAATEKYCRLALQEPDAEENPHEGLFLLAFALRRQEATHERYVESLRNIEEAIKAKLRGAREPEDPRYIKEKGTLLLLWWRHYRTAREQFPAPAISEYFAVQMLEEALQHPEADEDLKAQIYNNLTMVMIDREDEDSRAAARRYVRELRELRPIEGDIWRGSALIYDTIVWASWKLGECRDDDELRRQVARLEIVAKDARGISRDERAEIRDHVDKMMKSLVRAG